jgi:hypothetical protein
MGRSERAKLTKLSELAENADNLLARAIRRYINDTTRWQVRYENATYGTQLTLLRRRLRAVDALIHHLCIMQSQHHS